MKRIACLWLRGEPPGAMGSASGNSPRNGQPPISNPQSPLPHTPVSHTPVPRDGARGLGEPTDPLAQCSQFSPTVGMVEPDSLLLDATGMGRLFDGEERWAEQLVAHFQHQGQQLRLAVADTLGAAWAIAHFHSAFIIHHSQCLLIPSGETAAALRLLPIEALRLPPRTVELLHQLGIDLIDQLAALPREELSSRFGPELLRRWDQALGHLPKPIPVHRPPAEFIATWDFEPPSSQTDVIEAALERLVERLCGEMFNAGRGAARLNVRLDCLDHGSGRLRSIPLTVGLYRPTTEHRHLLGLLQLQLERQPLPGPAWSMELSVPETAPLTTRQPALLGELSHEDQPRAAADRLDALIDRLAGRLGPHAVLGVRLMADAVPERAWKGRPLVGSDGVPLASRQRGVPLASRQCRLGRSLALSNSRCNTASRRPARLFTRPRQLHAVSTAPDCAPERFTVAGETYQAAVSRGPERIETGWWRGRAVRRDYYDVETTDGRRLWLFQRRDTGRWFLHGAFE